MKFIVLLLIALVAIAQTRVDIQTQTKNVDFSRALATRPFATGTAFPPVCQVGQMFYKTDAPAGNNLYGCTATNLWSAQGAPIDSGSPGAAADGTTITQTNELYSVNPTAVPLLNQNNTFSGASNAFNAGTGYVSISMLNNGSIGTVQYKLVKQNPGIAEAILASTSDTSGLIGVSAGLTATSGNATIATLGRVPCFTDNTVATGDYIVSGSSGNCHSNGSTLPSGVQILGKAQTSATSGNTFVLLMTPQAAVPEPTPSTMFDTAGDGIYFPFGFPQISGASVAMANPHATIYWQFAVSASMTINEFRWYETALDNGSYYQWALYDSAGSRLAQCAGAVLSTVTSGGKRCQTSAPVTLTPKQPDGSGGVYYVGFTSESTIVGVDSSSGNAAYQILGNAAATAAERRVFWGTPGSGAGPAVSMPPNLDVTTRGNVPYTALASTPHIAFLP